MAASLPPSLLFPILLIGTEQSKQTLWLRVLPGSGRGARRESPSSAAAAAAASAAVVVGVVVAAGEGRWTQWTWGDTLEGGEEDLRSVQAEGLGGRGSRTTGLEPCPGNSPTRCCSPAARADAATRAAARASRTARPSRPRRSPACTGASCSSRCSTAWRSAACSPTPAPRSDERRAAVSGRHRSAARDDGEKDGG